MKRRQNNDSLKTEESFAVTKMSFQYHAVFVGGQEKEFHYVCNGFEHVVNREKILLAQGKGHHFATRVCIVCGFQHGSSNVYLCLSWLLGCKT